MPFLGARDIRSPLMKDTKDHLARIREVVDIYEDDTIERLAAAPLGWHLRERDD